MLNLFLQKIDNKKEIIIDNFSDVIYGSDQIITLHSSIRGKDKSNDGIITSMSF